MCHGGYRFPLGPVVFQVGQADVLEGWAMDVGQLLPTFTTARPQDHLGNKLAGLWQCNALEVPWVKSIQVKRVSVWVKSLRAKSVWVKVCG